MDILINFDFKFCHGEMEKHFKIIIININLTCVYIELITCTPVVMHIYDKNSIRVLAYLGMCSQFGLFYT